MVSTIIDQTTASTRCSVLTANGCCEQLSSSDIDRTDINPLTHLSRLQYSLLLKIADRTALDFFWRGGGFEGTGSV